jgi:hypothetical protein
MRGWRLIFNVCDLNEYFSYLMNLRPSTLPRMRCNVAEHDAAHASHISVHRHADLPVQQKEPELLQLVEIFTAIRTV